MAPKMVGLIGTYKMKMHPIKVLGRRCMSPLAANLQREQFIRSWSEREAEGKSEITTDIVKDKFHLHVLHHACVFLRVIIVGIYSYNIKQKLIHKRK